jgi:hypothetical protein
MTIFKADFKAIDKSSRIQTLNIALINQELKKILVFILYRRLATFISC